MIVNIIDDKKIIFILLLIAGFSSAIKLLYYKKLNIFFSIFLNHG